MITYAHRGFSGEYPENTMEAFRKSYDSGCEAIELDVHLSKDGHIMVIHDETVDRTTQSTGYVRDFTMAELEGMDAGGGEGIPSFDRYCAWVQDLPLITNIEIKTDRHYYPGIEEETIAKIKEYKLEDKVLISSFNHATLWKVKTLMPSLPCAILVNSKGIGNAGIYARTMGMEYFHPDGSTLTKEVVEQCHDQGVKVNAWTINDMGLLKKLVTWGVDGIITNHPDVVKLWIDTNLDRSE